MNAETLLLTYVEQDAAMPEHSAALSCNEACWGALCRAQVRKVLAVLEADAQSRGMFWSGRFIDSIITETGLTWPPGEDFGTYGGVETLPPKEG